MEGAVFVVAVAAGVVVSLIVWRRYRIIGHSSLSVVEPLGFLLKSWQMARIIGEEDKTIAVLTVFLRANSSEPCLVDEIVSSLVKLPRRQKGGSALLEEKKLRLFGRVRTVARTDTIISIVVGLPEEAKDIVSLDGNQWREINRAAGRGYLPLVVGALEKHNGAPGARPEKHRLVGVVLVEGEMDEMAQKSLRQLGTSAVRFLTLSPAPLAEWIHCQLFPNDEPLVLAAQEAFRENLSIKQREELIQQAQIIASADLEQRNMVLHIWRHSTHCKLISHNPEDEELSVT